MKTKILLFSILLLFFYSCSHNQVDNRTPASISGGIPSYVVEKAKNLRGQLEKEIATLDIGYGADLLDLEVVDGINSSVNYRYEVRPSYQDQLYTRVDKWKVKVELNPGDWLANSLPVGIKISPKSEVVFVRQFENQIKAATAIPLTPARLPLTAKHALSKLSPGTFVSIPTRLNIVVNAKTATPISGSFTAGANTYYLMSGEFLIHVFRLDKKLIRVKVIALKKKGYGASASVGSIVDTSGIDVWKLDFVENRIHKFLNTSLLEIGFAKEQGDLFMVDYLFNLEHQAAIDAYDHLMGSTLKFKSFALLNPFHSDKRVDQILVTDLSKVDGIAWNDRNLPTDQKRIERKFKGKNKFNSSSLKLRLGFKYLNAGFKRSFTKNHFSYYDKDDNQRHAVYDYLRRGNTSSGPFNLLIGENTMLDNMMILEANKKGEVKEFGFSDYGFTFETKQKRLYNQEQNDLKKHLIFNLPKPVSDQIDWEKLITKRNQKNARVYYQTFFHKDVMKELRGIDKKIIRKKLDKTVEEYKDYIDYDLIEAGPSNKFGFDKWWITRNMSIALSEDTSKYSRREKVQRFLKLQNNDLWRNISFRFLQSFLKPETINTKISFLMNWSSREVESTTYSFGQDPRTELYKSITYIKSVISNRSYDLRLVGYNPGGDSKAHTVVSE